MSPSLYGWNPPPPGNVTDSRLGVDIRCCCHSSRAALRLEGMVTERLRNRDGPKGLRWGEGEEDDGDATPIDTVRSSSKSLSIWKMSCWVSSVAPCWGTRAWRGASSGGQRDRRCTECFFLRRRLPWGGCDEGAEGGLAESSPGTGLRERRSSRSSWELEGGRGEGQVRSA